MFQVIALSLAVESWRQWRWTKARQGTPTANKNLHL